MTVDIAGKALPPNGAQEELVALVEGRSHASFKRLVVSSETVGYVCNEAQKGDIIRDISVGYQGLLLIVRQNDCQALDFVGQGFLRYGHHLASHSRKAVVVGADGGSRDGNFRARFEFALTAGDLSLIHI